jgi:hypothetical protein
MSLIRVPIKVHVLALRICYGISTSLSERRLIQFIEELLQASRIGLVTEVVLDMVRQSERGKLNQRANEGDDDH